MTYLYPLGAGVPFHRLDAHCATVLRQPIRAAQNLMRTADVAGDGTDGWFEVARQVRDVVFEFALPTSCRGPEAAEFVARSRQHRNQGLPDV